MLYILVSVNVIRNSRLMKINSILCVAISGVLSGSPADVSTERGPMQVINLNTLYPIGILSIQTSKKFVLEHGLPTPEISKRIDDMESQPVEERLANIVRALCWKRKRLSTATPEYASQFIDVRLLRLLIRIAVNRRNPNEMWIRTACDVIQYFQSQYPQVSSDHLTPQLILDWYSMLGEQTMTLRGHPDIIFGFSNSSEPQRLHIGRAVWHKYVLQPRRKRLALTGYDR